MSNKIELGIITRKQESIYGVVGELILFIERQIDPDFSGKIPPVNIYNVLKYCIAELEKHLPRWSRVFVENNTVVCDLIPLDELCSQEKHELNWKNLSHDLREQVPLLRNNFYSKLLNEDMVPLPDWFLDPINVFDISGRLVCAGSDVKLQLLSQNCLMLFTEKELFIVPTIEGTEWLADTDGTDSQMYEFLEEITCNTEISFISDLGDAGFGLTSACGVTSCQLDDDGRYCFGGGDLWIDLNSYLCSMPDAMLQHGYVKLSKQDVASTHPDDLIDTAIADIAFICGENKYRHPDGSRAGIDAMVDAAKEFAEIYAGTKWINEDYIDTITNFTLNKFIK